MAGIFLGAGAAYCLLGNDGLDATARSPVAPTYLVVCNAAWSCSRPCRSYSRAQGLGKPKSGRRCRWSAVAKTVRSHPAGPTGNTTEAGVQDSDTGLLREIRASGLNLSGRSFDRQEPAYILPEQLRKSLVEIGADRDIALVAGVVLGELLNHAGVLFQPIALKHHRARL